MSTNLISQVRKLRTVGGVFNTLHGVQNLSFCRMISNARKSFNNGHVELLSGRSVSNPSEMLSRRLLPVLENCQINSNSKPINLNTNLCRAHSLHTTATGRVQNNEPEKYKTKVSFMSADEDAPLTIKGMSMIGFRLSNNMVVHGSIAMFQESVLSWNVYNCCDINEASLSLFHMLAPKYELLILGIGDRENQLDVNMLTFLKRKGVNVEAMPTKDALALYNTMLFEGRKVVGAFIPPRGLKVHVEQAMEALMDQGHMPWVDKEEIKDH